MTTNTIPLTPQFLHALSLCLLTLGFLKLFTVGSFVCTTRGNVLNIYSILLFLVGWVVLSTCITLWFERASLPCWSFASRPQPYSARLCQMPFSSRWSCGSCSAADVIYLNVAGEDLFSCVPLWSEVSRFFCQQLLRGGIQNDFDFAGLWFCSFGIVYCFFSLA